MNTDAVRAIAVVVPAHNEAELLERCLSALRVAMDELQGSGIRCVVRVVLDDCTDASSAIVRAHGLDALTVTYNVVGQARGDGTRSALAALSDFATHQVWTAHSDADSAVPPNWLTEQVERAALGADVFLGTVRPDFADLTPWQRTEWLATHLPGRPNGHVHGASLGMRASTYLEVGGFLSEAEHEDVTLVERARARGARLVASDTAEVLTSGRTVGRTPGGYAGYLREQIERVGT